MFMKWREKSDHYVAADGVSKRGRTGSNVAIGLTFVAALWVNPALAQVNPASYAVGRQQALMDRQQEVALALSACPVSVAGQAAVYVLDKPGYVKVRESQNGFTAIVQHSQPNSQEPHPRYLKVAELRAQGKSAEEIENFVSDAFAKGIFQAPTRPGIDYMLSKENVVVDEKGVVRYFPPHVMFYGPNLTNADLGSDGKPTSPVFVAGKGPHALIIVPVETHASEVLSDKIPNSPSSIPISPNNK